MFQRLRQILAIPIFSERVGEAIFSNEDIHSLKPVLDNLLWTLFAVDIVALIYYLLLGTIQTSLAIGVSGLPVLLALALNRRGKIGWSIFLVAVSLVGVSTYLMFRGDGSHDTAVLLLPVAIIVASLFLSKHGVLLTASLSIAALGSVVYGQLSGSIRTLGATPASLINDLAMAILILIITAIAVYILSANMRHNLSLARTGALDLAVSNRQLQVEIAERQRAQVALQSSETRLRSLLAALPDLILVLGAHGECLDLFTANESLLVAPRDQQIGRTVHDILSPADAEQAQRVIDQAMATRTVQEYEYHLPTPSGRLWFQARIVAYDDPQGVRILWVARDITKQKQAEGALKQSEEYFRALIENSSDSIAVLDSHFQNKYRGPAPTRTLCYADDEAMKPLELVHPDDVAPVTQGLEALARQPGGSVAAQIRLKHKDGSWRWVHINAKNMLANPAVNGIVFNYHDITDRIAAEENLQQSERLFRALIEDSSEGVLLINPAGIVTYRSPAVDRLTGYTKEERIGRSVWENAHPDDLQQIKSGIAQEYSTPGSRAGQLLEFRLRTKDGAWRWFESSIKNMVDEPAVAALVVNFRDITERKQAVETLRESESKLRAILEHSQDAIGVHINGIWEQCNPAAVQLFGVSSSADLIGTPIINVIAPDERARISEYVRGRAQGTHAPMSYATRGLRSDGAEFDMDVTVSSFELDRKPHVLVILRDITQRKRAEEKLRESEERFRALFDRAGYAMGLAKSGVHLMVNASYLKLFCHNAESEVIGHSLLDDIAPEERTRVEELFRRRSSGEPTPSLYETRGIRADGTVFDMDVRASTYEHGGETFTIGIMRDITEQNRAAGKMRQLSRAVEQSPVSIVITDTAGCIEYVNSKFTQVTGYSFEEVMGGNPRILKSGETAPEEYKRLWDSITAGSEWRGEFHNKKKNGELYWEDAVISPIADERGVITHFLAVKEDITERKRSEIAAKESEERFRMLSEAAFEGIAIADHGKLLDVNTRLAEMMGCEVEEMIGRDVSEFVAPEAKNAIMARISAKVESPVQHMSRKKDGTIFPVQVQSRRIPYEGKELRVTAIRDITESQRAEQQIQTQFRRLNALRSIDTAITSFLDLPLVLKLFLEQVTDQLGVDAAAVLVLGKATQTLDYASGRGFRTQALRYTHLRVGEGLAGRVALERTKLHVPDLRLEKSDFAQSPLMATEEFIAYFGVPLIAKGQVQGVLEIFNRQVLALDQEGQTFLETLGTQAAIAIENMTLFNALQQSNLELSLAYDTTLEGWSRALDLRDKETEGHTQRVTELAVSLSRDMGIGDAELVHVRRGALLHDIGKMGIPDSILLKPGSLTADEWVTMRMHPEFAYRLLSSIAYLRLALDIPYCHHEKWDGSGYPRGLKGEEIPLPARIFAVVDVWDALISDRPYRPAWTHTQARAWIQEQAGTHFDPRIVERFMRLVSNDQA